jgi:hypothetical protein
MLECPASSCHCPASGCHCPASSCHCPASGCHCPASSCHCPASGCHCPASGCHCPASGCHCPASGCHCPASGCHRQCIDKAVLYDQHTDQVLIASDLRSNTVHICMCVFEGLHYLTTSLVKSSLLETSGRTLLIDQVPIGSRFVCVNQRMLLDKQMGAFDSMCMYNVPHYVCSRSCEQVFKEQRTEGA